MDGARLANAIVSLGCSPAAATRQACVDILSFGATKNGGLAAEAIVVFDPRLIEGLGNTRKRGGHLFSKSRFFAAQLLAYLENDLWRRNAEHANGLAGDLAMGLEKIPSVEFAFPVNANELFVRMPDRMANHLRANGFTFYDWEAAGPGGRRLVTSWQSTGEETASFLKAAAEA